MVSCLALLQVKIHVQCTETRFILQIKEIDTMVYPLGIGSLIPTNRGVGLILRVVFLER